MNPEFGKILIAIGVIFCVVGLIVLFRVNIPFLGKLPGDIHIKRDNFQFYFPLATCILLSVLFTLILRLFRK